MNNEQRYRKQINLPEIGEDGQKRLRNASILCVGAGGLGSPALLYLAAAGIGQIGIIDFDRIEVSNLQRQILFETKDIGQSKATHAKGKLLALNPDIIVEAYDEQLNAQNIKALFQSYDLIIDGTDNFETKFLINDAAVKYNKPWIYGAIQGFDGQVAVFDATQGSCYRCLYPDKPKTHITNCAESGVIGAVAGITGVTQALQAIQIIAHHESFLPLIGKLWVLDSHTMESKILNIPRNSNCPSCSRRHEEIVLNFSSPVCGFIPEVTYDQVIQMSDIILIDVREQEEWDSGHIENSTHFPLSKLAAGHIPDCAMDKDIILFCQRGVRSLEAAQILKEHGFSNLYSLSGGYEDWIKKDQPYLKNGTKV
ncbi:MAG: HesA/MoeB/ThiF family protein [Alphaproteobacteria bacterium]|nr:HesA/MoeB/ThiF family protein [Alphaproteobacteria bacterium]MCB9984718.1 ThiF family adenylyltransferase [Micavibrio sp.]